MPALLILTTVLVGRLLNIPGCTGWEKGHLRLGGDSLDWLLDILVSLDHFSTMHSTELKLFSQTRITVVTFSCLEGNRMSHLFQTILKLLRESVIISQISHLQGEFGGWT